PVAASDTSTDAPPGRGTTFVTKHWYIDDLALGGKARARWPTLTSAASGPARPAEITSLVLSIVPAARIHVCTSRGGTAPTVSVSVSAWAWFTTVPRGTRRVRSRMSCAAAADAAARASMRATTVHRVISVAVVVLAVHDVGAPGEQAHVRDLFERV